VIVGIGVDVVEIARIRAALSRTPGLACRLFAQSERDLPVASLAARFAAKEATAKALGAPPGLAWIDVQVRRDGSGPPELEVSGTVAHAARMLGVSRWHLSLSHDAGLSIAMVVAEG
jgi:holo-[acyl-carrier protein] synthase